MNDKIPMLQEFLEAAKFIDGKMFSCFYTNILGDMHNNYVVEKEEENYVFKCTASSIDGDNKETINVVTMPEQKYVAFLAKVFSKTKDWKESYLDSESEEVKWKIEFDDKVYYGGNSKPSDYYIVQDYIINYFMKNKYDVKPENNVPREVYGIPRPFDEDK